MSKFKVGDKVKCIEHGLLDTTYGNVYEVLDVSEFNGEMYFTYIDDVGDDAERLQSRFELVQEDDVLTPEEVFEHLRKGTKLQHFHGTHGWRDVTTPKELYYEDICVDRFRIKPEPEVIELNGKKYREIVD
ncbi:hypothetical protein Aristophanes_00015 [Acinetobacter phage Aristophanes]|uniref:Uncharacterized protein n=1 Tax=Acinetobacter phage Aristophanes TaxID=2759203 RepID=A0A7G9VYM4_BPACA|nr:hypothetical protein Aristophanes_00015 [Acinetobacter phage Aristophanes]